MWLYYITPIILLLFLLWRRHFNYWKDKNVPGPEPNWFVGNIGQYIFNKRSIGDVITDIYKKYDGCPFVGMYKGWSPSLVIRDTNFIKNMIVKDFKHFEDNDFYIDKKVDPLFGRNPFVLKGEEWRTTRAQLTPCFTSGKIKSMYPLFMETCRNMIQYINKQLDSGYSTPFEAKELCTKFTLDNVTSCAFGINGQCFHNSDAEFIQLANKFISPTSWSLIKMFSFTLFPKLGTVFPIRLVSKEVEDKLFNLVTETIKYRKDNNIDRKDFLQYIIELKNKVKSFSDLDVTAHAASFFGDGYETSSIVMSFILFELASNPDVQTKLREEIAGVENESFENIMELPYLDACMNESLRKNPVILHLGKTCTEKYTYRTIDTENFKDMTVDIEPGTSIIIPVGALQLDEKIFNEAHKYIPERFIGENKKLVNRYAFLPFGEGPRSCLGQRFGIAQIKIGVFHLIKNFQINVNKKTKLPLTFDPVYIMLSPIGGLWLDFEKI